MIKEPIYSAVLSLSLNDAWNKIVDFSKEYSIKKKNKKNSNLVLDISYPIRMFTYFTWAEGITISLKRINSDKTKVNVCGKVLLSPHHLFRSITLNRKKIDKGTFSYKIKTFFRRYEAITADGTSLRNAGNSLFWISFISSLISLFCLLVYLFLFHMPINSPNVIISAIVFLFFQAALIIWFTRDCYSRNNLSVNVRNKWIAYICLTGFIGCFLYYIWGPWEE